MDPLYTYMIGASYSQVNDISYWQISQQYFILILMQLKSLVVGVCAIALIVNYGF